MARTHDRSPSPSPTDSLLKKLKTVHTTDPDFPTPVAQFADGLFDAGNIQRLHTSYAESEPFKHATVENLFQDELLRKVKDECLNRLSFTEKETDIYKVCARNYIFEENLQIRARNHPCRCAKRVTWRPSPTCLQLFSLVFPLSLLFVMLFIPPSSVSLSVLSRNVGPSQAPNKTCPSTPIRKAAISLIMTMLLVPVAYPTSCTCPSLAPPSGRKNGVVHWNCTPLR